jgi:uncharacterized membrane protein
VNRSKASLALPGIVLALLWVRLAWVWPGLPARIPTHFDAGGQADGWMDPRGFVLFNAIFPALLLAVLLGTGLLVGRLPARFVNLPHRDYWLAPERLAATRAKLLAHLAAMATLTLLLFAAIAEICLHLARTGGELLPAAFFWALGLFLAATLLVIVSLYRTFGRPPRPTGG